MTAAEAVVRAIASLGVRERVLIAGRRATESEMQEADTLAALLDAVRALQPIGAPYALIGGVAVGVHSGVPRATLDVDLAVLSTATRQHIIDALLAAGFRLMGEHPHSVNFRHLSGEPVQLAFDPTFDPMIGRAERITIGGTDVRMVRKDDLIEMKQRAAQDPARRRSKALRDQADVALLLGDVPDPDEGW